MLLPLQFIPGIKGILDEEEIEKCMDNNKLSERLRKSLYYGKLPTTDRPSLPVTEIAVEFFQDAAPRELGKVDTFIASSYGRRACMSPCAMMLGMLYIERLKKRNPEYLRNASSSDLFLISMMMASKYLYDEGVDEEVFNDEWAESANMDLDQLNELERNFLKAIEWNLFVQPEDFWRILREVERRIAWEKGQEHGSYNYMDLMVLSENGIILKIMKALMFELGKVIMVCSVAYVAGVLTIVGSTASVLYVRQQLPPPDTICPPLPSWHSLTESVFRASVPEIHESQPEILQSESSQVGQINSADSKESRPHGNETEATTTSSNKSQNTKLRKNSRQHSSLQFPGLLTLVMLKDTVLQFVAGVHSKYSTGGHSKNEQMDSTDLHGNDLDLSRNDLDLEPTTVVESADDDSLSGVICSCGCCGPTSGYDKLCYNLTSPFANNKQGHAHGRWNSIKPKLRSGQGHMNSDMDYTTTNCFPDFACQCCCAVTPTREWVPRSHDSSDLLRSTLSFHRIEEPFAGMTFGFGTSPSMAAA